MPERHDPHGPRGPARAPRARRRRRATPRVLLVVLVAGAALLRVPYPTSTAAPATVVRTTAIDATSLLGRGLQATPSGVRATAHVTRRAVTTRAVTSCAPIWFDGLAFTWSQRRGRPATLAIATGASRTSLGASQTLEADGGPDPDTSEATASAGRLGSEYVWTGGARCVRVRFRLPAGATIGSVRAVFLNTSGTSAGPRTGPNEVGPSLVEGTSTPIASAATREPHLITRPEWGANPKLMNCTPDVASFLTNAFVHHTAGSNAYSRAQADDVVRGIYAYHTQVRGWCDIGYNFLVDRYGDVFEGRSGGVTNDVVGAAQMGFNTGAFSVSMMGTFDTATPPRPALRALERILAWRLDVAHIDPRSRQEMTSGGGSTTRYKKGTIVRLHAISGHRDTGLTDCPGGRLYALLRRIRRRVARIGLPKMYDARLSVSSVAAGEQATVRIRARGSTTLRWSVELVDHAGTGVEEIANVRDDRLGVRWPALVDAEGSYMVVVTAHDGRGRRAMPASLPLVVRPAPSPTPTVSP